MTEPSRDIADLLALMKTLRSPEGCPWDREQTFETVAPYTIEEAYEVSAAITEQEPDHIKEELGDLLFQAVFHARIAEERGLFDFGDVVEAVTAKMIARHPHVFGEMKMPEDAAAQTKAWEVLKRQERKAKQQGLLDDVPLALPALIRAYKLQKKAATVGFDWKNAEKVLDKIVEEAGEVVAAQAEGEAPEHLEEEIGDLLFVLANLARHLKVDPETALNRTNQKFTRRFKYIEDELHKQHKEIGSVALDVMETLWEQAKAQERSKALPPNRE
jgi:ATP diphosphatase